MNVASKHKIDCCGCTACANICPQSAIKMESDSLGFLYPRVNSDKCTDCGICIKKCQFKTDYDISADHKTSIVFGVRNKDGNELLKSQSGAAFYTIAEYLMNAGYIIYGVGLDDVFRAVHKRVSKVEEIQNLRGSKYIQSDLGNSFELIKIDLQEGKRVLFSGTACQVAGLLSYIPKKLYANLLTLDIVCHGVPAPAVWSSYLAWIEKKYNNKIQMPNFRNKKYGWHSCRETFLMKNGIELTRDSFRFFLMSDSHFATRTSCSKCPFTNFQRVSDLTIGDFWGWEKHHTQYNDNLGVSLLLLNTPKGQEVYKSILPFIDSIPSDKEECLQPQLIKPVHIDLNLSATFKKDFEENNFDYILKKYANESWKYKLRSTLSSLKRKFLK